MSKHRFGAPERIALEVDVEPDESPMGGAYLALWLGGHRLGATDRVEQLSTFLDAMKRWVAQVPPAPPELAGQPADAVFAAVHGLLNDPDPGRADFPWTTSDLYQRITLSPNGCGPFDGDHAFVLQEPGGDRVIFKSYEASNILEAKLAAGEVAATVRALLAHPWKSHSPHTDPPAGR